MMNNKSRVNEEDIDSSKYEKFRIDEEKEAIYNAKMRTLLSMSLDLKEAAERGEDDCVEETTNIIRQADEVLKKAKCSSTAYLDAQILHNSSLIYKNFMEKMDSRLSEFKAKEYAENIVRYLENKAENRSVWTVLEEEAALVFNNTGGWTWQLGAIDIDETVQAPKRRQKRDAIIDVPMKNPRKVKNLEKEEEDLEHHMHTIMSLLCKWENANKEPLQLWDLVLHPTSFSETIENIFHVSHLVKEGLVYLALDRDGLPIIKTVRKGQKGEKSETDNIPVAVTIDMKEWEELVDAFGVKRSMIPTRNSK